MRTERPLRDQRKFRRLRVRARPAGEREKYMKVSIDKFSKVPVYLQIADQIKSQIISGALPRGSALPRARGNHKACRR